MDSIQAKWEELCGTLQVPQDMIDKWWMCIHDSYQNTGRHYHTLSHINNMLSHLKEFEESLQCCEEVSLAIYFHELIRS